MTIAKQLDGKLVEGTKDIGVISYNVTTGTVTFEDGSQALYITKYIDCEPFVTSGLSTMSKKAIKYWKAI